MSDWSRDAGTDVTVDGAARALCASPYFRGLDEPWLRLLGEAASPRAFAAGEELATDRADAGRLYLVAAGEVRASTPPDPDGIAEIVGEEGPGGVFGSGLITGEEDVPLYRAVGPVEAYVWERVELERLLSESRELRRQVESRLSVRRRRNELVDLLRRTPLFRRSSRSAIRWLLASSTLTPFEAGSVVCREGEAADAMFLIVSGSVSFHRDGAPDLVRHLRRGDFFGEIALARRSARTASAVAETTSELLVVPRDAFDVLQQRSAAFREAVRSTASERLASDLAARPDPELVWLVNDTPRPTAELAALVAAALREVAGRVATPRGLTSATSVSGALDAARSDGAAYAVVFSDRTDGGFAADVVERAGSVVHITDDDAAPFPHRGAPLHRVHHVVVADDGASPRRPLIRRDAFALSLPAGIETATLEALPVDTRRALGRIARAVAHRRVGIALGGGAAWGYAHVALLRGLERAQIPVDLVVGVSAGSLVGAFYASQGLRGLDRLVAARYELSAAAVAAIATTSSVDLFLRRHVPETRLEELQLPLATVAVEAQTGREKVFRHGSLAAAVRASCSLPGVFGRPLDGGSRYLDACVRNNVPVSYCTDADADFVIACDVVPAPRASPGLRRRGVRARALELLQVNRVTDTVRSLYWLASDSARADMELADAVFAPDLAEFFPWDFHRGAAIVERAEAQLEEWLAATRARYEALARTSRVDD